MTRRLLAPIVLAFALVASVVSPAPVSAEKINVLIVGDSTATVLRWAPESMVPLWKSNYNVTLEVWGCQKLVSVGCLGNGQKSALDFMKKHKDDGIDYVMVATGYNDTGAEYVRRAIRTIDKYVKSMGAELIWLTYRRNGNVRVKNKAFNEVVWQESKRLGYRVFDWELIARERISWFSGDRVHMSRKGGVNFGKHIKKYLDGVTGAVPTTTVPVPTTTAA